MDKWYPASGIAVPCFRNCGTRKLEWRCNLGRILHVHAYNNDASISCLLIHLLPHVFSNVKRFLLYPERGRHYNCKQ